MQIALGKSESDEALKNLSLLSCHVKGIQENQSSPLPLTNIHYRKQYWSYVYFSSKRTSIGILFYFC